MGMAIYTKLWTEPMEWKLFLAFASLSISWAFLSNIRR